MTESIPKMLKRPQHLLSLSKEEKRSFIDSIDHVISDIDGVIWSMEHNVPGASAAYNMLQGTGKQLTFVTNNSVRTMENCLDRFKKLNIKTSECDIWHPAKSIVEFLNASKFTGLIYAIATQGFKQTLRNAGYQLIDGPTEILEESFSTLSKHIFDTEPVRAVIIDVDFNMSSVKLMRAHTYLRNPDCVLIAGATDELLPVRKDINIIGPGAFTKILIDVIDKPVITLGKPGYELGQMLIKHYDIKEPSRTLMIGDMLQQDISFGKLCGFQTLLVLSGGCSANELTTTTDSEFLPDYYADSVADITELMRNLD